MFIPSEARSYAGLLHFIVDLIFPPACSGCGRVDVTWCKYCQRDLETCPVTPHFRNENLVSTGLHTGILQQAIHGLKYDHLRHLAEPLGDRLVRLLAQIEWSADLIIPIPSHESRLKTRGYNQAQLLGEALAIASGIPCIPNAARRTRETRSQVGLNQIERRLNVADAFRADAMLVSGKTVLLVDDVLTTGATLTACAQTILDAGARQVYGLTVTTASL